MEPHPLPIETVRDLLGIVRVLYALQKRQGNHQCARDLQRAGRQLRRALEIAIRKADRAAHADAWKLANEAISTIGRVQRGVHQDLEVAAGFALERVSKQQYRHENERDAKREARIKRG